MPGVPSGKACDACRKQKKKCDETQPTCSRCQRLGIACVGSGTRRYKFEIQTVQSGNRRKKLSQSDSSSSTTPDPDVTTISRTKGPALARCPVNDRTVLTKAFINCIHFDKTADLRYNLTWAYGGFMLEVPKRFGTSLALDTAARALVTSHIRFSTGEKDTSTLELMQYSEALGALRGAVGNPKTATDTNTLCAVSLLLFAQLFIGGLDNEYFTGHCEGAAKILQAKGVRYNRDDQFECSLLHTMRGPLLFEGLFNPKICFSDEEWATLITDHFTSLGPSNASRMVACWAALPRLTKAARRAWKSRPMIDTAEFDDHIRQAYERYSMCVHGLNNIREEYFQAERDFFDNVDRQHPLGNRIMYAHHQRVYTMALFTVSFLNGLIRAMIPENERLMLTVEAISYAHETVALADQVQQFRPMGSACMLMTLMVAWFAAVDGSLKAELKRIWLEFREDFPSTRTLKLETQDENCGFLGLRAVIPECEEDTGALPQPGGPIASLYDLTSHPDDQSNEALQFTL